jgi:membrane-anchored glycerophosphoryl diester phosphodiesterase (GDPDase)
MKEKINYSDIIRTAWRGLKSQFWLLTGLLIGFTIIYSLLFIFAIPAKGDFFSISDIIAWILCLFLFCLFQLGYLKNCFQTLDGEEPQFSSYGQVSRKLPGYFAASLIYSMIIFIGSVLFVLPGIYLALRLQFFIASMVDENTGIIKSFKRSWEITKGHSVRLFVVVLIMILINFIGQMALVVGMFAAIPLIVLMYGVVFRRLTTPTA